MRKLILLTYILFIAITSRAQEADPAFKKFDAFNTEVLKSHTKKQESKAQFDSLLKAIRMREMIRQELILPKAKWVFPLKGYKSSAIGGTRGNGYSDKGYRYLDGNKHAAHPAHDIFINDKNQDCIDDHTHKPVDVLTVDDGWVIACTNQWDASSNLRGGRYIWIYHPAKNMFTYYAHNGVIFVHSGSYVRQGQKIAEVGRTGYNAYKKRSPTHLHFSAFRLKDGVPVPYNPYQQLLKARPQ